MQKPTKENVTKAIQDGASSVSAIARALGAKGNPSGSACKAIRSVIEDNGLTVGSTSKTPKTKTASKASAPKAKGKVTKVSTPKASKAKAVKGKNGNPFRPTSKLGILFDAASGKFRPQDEVIDEVANHPRIKEITKGASKEDRRLRVYHSYTILASKHPSNKGRATVLRKKAKDGTKLIKIVAA